MQKALRLLGTGINAVQFTLPKIGMAWMFALLTSNFNRITIYELGVVAVLVTTMIGLDNFLSPMQVYFGRLIDRHPILGFRRGPYLLGGLLIASLIFPFLPRIAVGMGEGNIFAFVAGFVLMIIFGVGLALSGSSHLAWIADRTSERNRGIVVALVWTVMIASMIVASSVMKRIMPDYDPAGMQQLYNLATPIVLVTTLLALLGNERRLNKAEIAVTIAEARNSTPPGNIFTAPFAMLRANRVTRNFFFFIFFSTLGVFLQDSILEVFGAEVFNMSVRETTSFQQIWGGGVLLSMIVVGAITAIKPFSRQNVTLIGSIGTAIGLLLLSMTAYLEMQTLLYPALLVMGVATGIYTVGALSAMMEMSAVGATATYMGLWGMAQALGNGLASILGGGLHTLFIGSGFLPASTGYAAIFALESSLMTIGALFLVHVSVTAFRSSLTRSDVSRAMEAGAA